MGRENSLKTAPLNAQTVDRKHQKSIGLDILFKLLREKRLPQL